jgi:hypothetical protein
VGKELLALSNSTLQAVADDLRSQPDDQRPWDREMVVAMFDNLTTTQARCTELLEENRRLKSNLRAFKEALVIQLNAELERRG